MDRLTTIRYDVNDYLKDIYGVDTVEECLCRDGGKALWDLYFNTAQVHSRTYSEFQNCILNNGGDRSYLINIHFLLPCCYRDIDKPDMSEEEAEALLMLTDTFLDSDAYRETMLLLNDYRLPEKQRNELFRMLISHYEVYEEDRCPFHARAVCQKHLLAIYPECETSIRNNTTDAIRMYADLMSTKARMMNRFISYYRSGFRDITVFFGLDLLDYVVRTTVQDRETCCSEKMRELLESLDDDFNQFLPVSDEKETDETEFWKAVSEFYPDDELNCRMFEKQMSYMTADPDTEWLNHLEYFMSKTDKLKQYYRRFPETVVTAFVYRKPNIGHDLLLRMADAPYQEITVRPAETYHLKKMAISRAEVLMLFLNMHPAFEDDREIMPDSVLDDIIIRTFYPETDIGMTDLISLLCCSKTFRLKDDDLLRWTEAYFDELFVNERKEEE